MKTGKVKWFNAKRKATAWYVMRMSRCICTFLLLNMEGFKVLEEGDTVGDMRLWTVKRVHRRQNDKTVNTMRYMSKQPYI